MKRKIILFYGLILVLLSGKLQAQDIAIGLRGGVNSSTVVSNESDITKEKIGANFGALLNYSLKEKIGLTSELNYTNKGWVSSTNIVSGLETHLSYLEIPIYVSYYLTKKNSSIRPKLFVGISFAKLISAKVKTDNISFDVTGGLKSLDISSLAGLGFDKKIGKNTLGIDLRYNLGLSNLHNSDIVKESNRTFSLNLSYFVNLKIK